MENLTIGKVSLAYYLDQRKKAKEGAYPVRYRVIHDRKARYINAGFRFTPEDWLNLNQTRNKDLKEDRDLLRIGFKNLETTIKDIMKSGEYTHDKLMTRLKGAKNLGIEHLFDKRVKSLEDDGRIGTAIMSKCAKNHLIGYHNGITIDKITISWLKKYQKYCEEQGMTLASVGMYLRELRTIFNDLIHNGTLQESQYPFARSKRDTRYRIPKSKGRKRALSISEIANIMYCELPENSNIAKARDLFIFSYLVNGIGIGDVIRLKFSNIRNGEITFIREKTKRTDLEPTVIAAPLLPETENIIEKWGNPDRKPENYIFDVLKPGMSPSEQQQAKSKFISLLNWHLRELGSKLNIEGLSTYVSRHSHATILMRTGAPIQYISESLGHTSPDTTKNYLAGFESEERLKRSKSLIPQKPKTA